MFRNPGIKRLRLLSYLFLGLVISIFSIFSLISCDTLGMPVQDSSAIPEEEVTSVETENTEEPSSEENDTVQEEEPGEVSTDPVDEEEAQEPEEHSIEINVYYVDEQAEYIIGETRTITGAYKVDFIEVAFNELLKQPETQNIFNIIPLGTEILSSEFIDNIAFINLSSDFVDNKWEDGLTDVLVISCIASTITEIPEVEGVLFNIEGERLDKYGSLDISNPVGKNPDLIK
ncbi:hypothetical protein GF312_22090 [Candidatus Poribacteria bacterium]|nr:hypothetical protein [Candidatus Poribacteria bacterium]